MALNLNLPQEHFEETIERSRTDVIWATWQSYHAQCLEMLLPATPESSLLLEEDPCGDPGEDGVNFL